MPAGGAIITSIARPQRAASLGVDGWRRWSVDTVAGCCRAVEDDGVAVFFQTE